MTRLRAAHIKKSLSLDAEELPPSDQHKNGHWEGEEVGRFM